MKRIFSLLIAAVMLFSLFSCDKKDSGEQKEEPSYTASDIAMSTEHFSFTRAEVSYVFHKNYSDFKYNYPDSVDMYNIDTDSSLKNQIYYDDYTWFKYFADAATEYMEQLLVFCEGALKEGLELTDEDREDIDAAVRSWTDYAKDYAYTEKELFGKFFNGDVTPDVMRSFMEKETLAVKYQSLIASEYSFTDEELKSYVEENRDSFYYVDYLKFTVDEDDVSMPKATAEGIAGAKSADEFLSLVSAYLTDTLKDENAEETLGKCAVTGEKKKSYGKFSEWAFGGAKENDTFIDENAVDGQYTVYMLTKAPYIDETPTKDARIIRENVSSHNSYQDTVNYLNGLLDKWKEEGGTEDAFAALAEKESDDTETKDYGGLLNCVSRFDTTVAENIRSWLFEDGRTVGDTGVVKGESCYYAVYFSGEDAPGWKISAQIGMGQKKMQEDYEALEKQYPVTSDEAVIASLDA